MLFALFSAFRQELTENRVLFCLGIKLCQVPFIDSIMLLIVPICQVVLYTFFMPQPRKKQPDDHIGFSLSIGQNLQRIRIKRGLTQKELGDSIGVTREAIAAYERGRVHILDCTLIDLAKVLRVAADEILGIAPSYIEDAPVSRRFMKRITIVETLPESIKKHVLKNIDDAIKANT